MTTNATNDKLLDHLVKLYMVKDNLSSISVLSYEYFNTLNDSLSENPDFKNHPTRQQLSDERVTAMLYQLSVGYSYALLEIIDFLKRNNHCDELFLSNRVYEVFNENRRLICELRNNIIFHGKVDGEYFRDLKSILNDLNITKEESLRKIWITLECGSHLSSQILDRFGDYMPQLRSIMQPMFIDEGIDIIQNYFSAQEEFKKIKSEKSI